jgi:hypothetical protein
VAIHITVRPGARSAPPLSADQMAALGWYADLHQFAALTPKRVVTTWILSFLQMPVVFAGRIFDISIQNISNYTTMIMHNVTSLIHMSLAE